MDFREYIINNMTNNLVMEEIGPFDMNIKHYKLLCRPYENSLMFILADIGKN